jgi:serine/threonine-protein kinase
MAGHLEGMLEIARTRSMSPALRALFLAGARVDNKRLRASRTQFVAEMFAYCGEVDEAVARVAESVEAGLGDAAWLERCPLLLPLRDDPKFRELAAVIRDRAAAVREAIASGQRLSA